MPLQIVRPHVQHKPRIQQLFDKVWKRRLSRQSALTDVWSCGEWSANSIFEAQRLVDEGDPDAERAAGKPPVPSRSRSTLSVVKCVLGRLMFPAVNPMARRGARLARRGAEAPSRSAATGRSPCSRRAWRRRARASRWRP